MLSPVSYEMLVITFLLQEFQNKYTSETIYVTLHELRL
jgi:hypothetical protein